MVSAPACAATSTISSARSSDRLYRRDDPRCGVTVAVGVHGAAAVEFKGPAHRRDDGPGLGRAVDHRGRAQPALLAGADVDRGRLERRDLEQAARGIADHGVDLRRRAPVQKLPQGCVRHRVVAAGYEGVDHVDQRTPRGVGVGSGEDQADLGSQGLEGGQQLPERPLGRVLVQRDGVEGDEEIARPQPETQPLLHGAAVEQAGLAQIVEPGVAGRMDVRRVLAQLSYPAGRVLVGHEMQVRHLGDRMPDRLVEGTFGDIAACQMRDGNAGDERALCRGQQFEAVAEQDQQIGPEPVEGVGEAYGAEAHGLRDPDRRVRGQQHLDLLVDREAVRLDDLAGQAELGREVHAGGDQLQGQVRVPLQLSHDGMQKAVLGPGAGHHTDLAFACHGHSGRDLNASPRQSEISLFNRLTILD
jgi:hypothetical protein